MSVLATVEISVNVEGLLTETRLVNTSTTPLRPGADLALSRSVASIIPNNFPVSCTSRQISAVKVNAVPKAGLMDVAENRDKGLVGTLEAWPFVIWKKSQWWTPTVITMT